MSVADGRPDGDRSYHHGAKISLVDDDVKYAGRFRGCSAFSLLGLLPSYTTDNLEAGRGTGLARRWAAGCLLLTRLSMGHEKV